MPLSVYPQKRLRHGLPLACVHLMDKLGQRVNSHIEINITQEVLAQMTAMTFISSLPCCSTVEIRARPREPAKGNY